MTHIYPQLKPYRTDMLDVSDGHRIYIEQSGNENGLPVLFIHGGPGAGLSSMYRSLFNPDVFRIISFDQRGCGNSEPFASLKGNTTQALLDDIQAIRKFLNVKKWMLCGGSWGATLALLSAIEKPKVVSGMVLRGTFLARAEDYEWYMSPDGGPAQLFPEYYADFTRLTKGAKTAEAINQAYYDLFTSDDELKRTKATKAWSLWEHRIASLHTNVTEQDLAHDLHRSVSMALFECHFIKHRCFLEDNYILNNIDKITSIPGTIVHGRYDMVCKLEASHSLRKAWRNSQLLIIPEAGHCLSDPKVAEAVCHANDAMARFIKEEKS